PMEVELIPDSVASRRDSAKRTPLLILATLCLFALLGAAIFYFKKADEVLQKNTLTLTNKRDQLRKYDHSLKDVDQKLQVLQGESAQLEAAVNDRAYWVRLLDQMNNKFENEYLWLTQIEVMENGKSISQSPSGASAPVTPTPTPAPAAGAQGAAAANT